MKGIEIKRVSAPEIPTTPSELRTAAVIASLVAAICAVVALSTQIFTRWFFWATFVPWLTIVAFRLARRGAAIRRGAEAPDQTDERLARLARVLAVLTFLALFVGRGYEGG
jgi:hypothetical protein